MERGRQLVEKLFVIREQCIRAEFERVEIQNTVLHSLWRLVKLWIVALSRVVNGVNGKMENKAQHCDRINGKSP